MTSPDSPSVTAPRTEAERIARVMHRWRIEVGGHVCRHPADDISDCGNDADWLMQHGIALADERDALLRRVGELERERDDAIAHDRQPYPTAEAYERVCAVLKVRTAERDAALARVAKDPEWVKAQYDRRQTCWCGHRYGVHSNGLQCLAASDDHVGGFCPCQRWEPTEPRLRRTL